MVTPGEEANMLRFLMAAWDALPDDVREAWEDLAREYDCGLPFDVRIEGEECVARIGDVIIGRTPAEPIRKWRPGQN